MTCTSQSLEGLTFGGIHTTFGGLMGKPSQDIVRYITSNEIQRQKVKIKVFPPIAMLGEVPLPSYGGIFTQIDKNTVALTGGIVKPNMFINPVEILVKDLNIEEERSVGALHILKLSDDLETFEWDFKGDLFIPRAHHIAKYSKTSITLIIIGGLNVGNSTILPGERLSLDPVLISLDTYIATNITVSPMETYSISGAASFQAEDREIVFFGGYTSGSGF